MPDIGIEYNAELVESLHCQLGIIKVQVRMRDGKVTWAKILRASEAMILGQVELEQLYIALDSILEALKKLQKEK